MIWAPAGMAAPWLRGWSGTPQTFSIAVSTGCKLRSCAAAVSVAMALGTPLVEHLGSVVLRTAWRYSLAPGRMIREVAASALGSDENARVAVRRLEQAFRAGSMGLLGWD